MEQRIWKIPLKFWHSLTKIKEELPVPYRNKFLIVGIGSIHIPKPRSSVKVLIAIALRPHVYAA
jgi:hypothetical protein